MRRRSEKTKPDVKGEGAGFIRRPKGFLKAAETPFVPSKAVTKRIAFRGESGICKSCYSCRNTGGKRAINDDLAEVLQK